MIFLSGSVADFTILPLRLSNLLLKLSCTARFQMLVLPYRAELPLYDSSFGVKVVRGVPIQEGRRA
jgi:hypothetical protein